MRFFKYVQCRDNVSGKTGTFIGDSDGNAVSPVMDSLAELFPWMQANGFVSTTDGLPWEVIKANREQLCER